jgi:probable F420-dependent oxidoreductase
LSAPLARKGDVMEYAVVVGGGQVEQEGHGLEAFVEQAQLAESLAFTTAFVPDHYLFEQMGELKTEQPTYELFALLGAIAQRTRSIKLGSHVACTLFRHPAMLARQFAQLDELSGGRVIAGVGAGWTRSEFEMFGLDFPPVSERLRMMDEAVEIMQALWTGEPCSFDGEHYRLRDAVVRPTPMQQPRPPLMLGGGGKGILRRAGRWADILHMVPEIGKAGTTTLESVSAFGDESVAEKLALVREEAKAAGRPDGAVRYATTIFVYQPADSEKQAAETAEGAAAMFGLTAEQFSRHPAVLAGTTDQMVEELQRREQVHGLSIVALEATGLDSIRDFAERIIANG